MYNKKNSKTMKLNVSIFRRKKKCEACMGKYLNSRKPEGTAQKAVYISRENHEAVKRIVGMAGGQGTTISGYVDNIVSEHLERYGAELENLHKQKSHGIVEQITISRW